MQARRFWPPIKHKLFYANIIIYGLILFSLLVFHRELIWAQKTLRCYLFSGNFVPLTSNRLIQKAMENARREHGDIYTSQSLLERAYKIDPYSQASLLLGASYSGQGDDNKALAYYNKYHSADPSHIGVYMEIIEILGRKQEHKAIEHLLTEAIELYRRRVNLYKPHYDPNVPKIYNIKALEIYKESQEGLKFFEMVQEKFSSSK